MSSNKIIISNEGANSYLNVRRMSRLYCGYDNNVTNLGLTQNIWQRFVYPSTGYTTYRNNDFSIDGSLSKFTYTGESQKWFKVDAVCNIYKIGGGSVNRNIEVQWRLNGNPVGSVRGSYMHDQDSQIISGGGELLLSNGDYLEPFIRNIENSDDCLLKNCSFIVKEDPEYAFVM